MKHIFKLLVICGLVSLAACTRSEPFTGRDKQYLAARSVQPLRVPPDISTSAFHNEYPVSDHYYPDKVLEVSLIPPGLYNNQPLA